VDETEIRRRRRKKETRKRKEALHGGANVSTCEVVSAGADEWASKNVHPAYVRQGLCAHRFSFIGFTTVTQVLRHG
jgi:hypothetical protein